MDMDCWIKGQTIPNDDGGCTIFINARFNQEQQILAYNHEVIHLMNDDFNKENVDMVEFEAHNISEKIYKKMGEK